MSNNFSIALVLLLLIGWIGYGTYHYANCICPGCITGVNTAVGVPFSIEDDTGSIATAQRSPQFTFGKSAPNFPDEAQAAFEDLKTYLEQNPDKRVAIFGQYTKKESPKGTLGQKRAEAIQQQLLDLGINERQTRLGSQVLKSLDFKDNIVEGAVRYEIEAIPASSHSLQIKNGAEVLAESPNNFIFPKSNYKYKTPADVALDTVAQKLLNFLANNPEKAINITGKYLEEETNGSVFSNLGEARAVSVKNYLIGKGIPADAINLSSRIDEFALRDDDNILHAIELDIIEKTATSADDIDAQKQQLQDNALTLYFESNKQTLNLDASQRAYLGDALAYLDKNPKGQIYLTGHTDNQGKEKVNIRLSRKRAEFVRDYFVENGIPKNRIAVRFKGPKEPIATNSTEAGRAKNRRVEVTVR